jgi:hypothetical protein
VTHRDGHSEETSLASPVDTSGSKNAVQQIGSTVEYLRRYTLLAALGLATSKDDDGHAAGGGATITDQQTTELRTALSKIGEQAEARFLKFRKVSRLEDIRAADFKVCMDTVQGSRK